MKLNHLFLSLPAISKDRRIEYRENEIIGIQV